MPACKEDAIGSLGDIASIFFLADAGRYKTKELMGAIQLVCGPAMFNI
jgi:hypothetical protein